MNGVICIYKEQGYTSFDVVAIIRKLCKTKKVGHGGTLDPMAEGVLPIFIGYATKAVDYCPDNTKEYRAGMQFGVTTDTQDITGNILSRSDSEVPESIKETLKKKFTGELLQMPPMYSAIKVEGKRLYDLARKGVEIEREPRSITVYSLDFEEFGDNKATVLVSCSKGTYIRTLIHDMGIEAGTGAVMTRLLRTRSGNFTLRDCYKIGEVIDAAEKGGPPAVERMLTPLENVFASLPAAKLNDLQTRMFLNGVVLDAERVIYDKNEKGPFRIMSSVNTVIGLGAPNADGDFEVTQRFGIKPPEKPGAKKDANGMTMPDLPPEERLKDISELKGVRFT